MAEKTLNYVSAMVCAILSYSYGELDGMLKALIFCMIIDYITGLIAAYKNKELSSEVGFLGLAKKFVMLLIVAVAHIVDMEIFSNAMFLKSAVCGFYIANEGLSILENTADLGVKYPKKLIKALKQVNNSDDEEEKDDEKDNLS